MEEAVDTEEVEAEDGVAHINGDSTEEQEELSTRMGTAPGGLVLPGSRKPGGRPPKAHSVPSLKRSLPLDLGTVGSKRPHVTPRASLRGVTSGIRQVGNLPCTGTCWVFVDAKNWDVLFSVLSPSSLQLLRVFVKDGDPDLISDVSTLIGDPSIPVSAWNPEEAASFSPCDMALVSYRTGTSSKPTFLDSMAQAGVPVLLSTGGFRHLSRPWRRSMVNRVSHAGLGGVTVSTRGLYVAHLVSDWNPADLLPSSLSVPRDLSTLLSFGAPISSSARAPTLTQVEPLRAWEVFPGSGVYHGKGLLPSFPTATTQIITPARGLPPTKWGVRPLTRQELFQAYDIGDRFHSLIPVLHGEDHPFEYDPGGHSATGSLD